MLVGGMGAVLFLFLIYLRTPHADTSYFAWSMIMTGVGVYAGIAFATWMASFTETVEEVSPALIAHGLAVWGWILRSIVAVAFLLLPQVIGSVTPLVESGPAVQAAAAREAQFLPTVQAHQAFLNDISARYPDGNVPDVVAKTVVETVGAEVATRLTTPEGKADFALLGKQGAQVQKAQKDSPKQWQHWFLICLLGQLVFLPLIFVLSGPWSPRRAREEAEAHERIVQEEMARLHIAQPA